MKSVLTSAQMRACDQYAVENCGISLSSLIDKAADALYDVYVNSFSDKNNIVTILCGKGNNGADGFALAKKMITAGYNIKVIAVFGCQNISEESQNIIKLISKETILDFRTDEKKVFDQINNSDCIIDCIFGIGFRGKLEYSIISLIKECNKKKVIAADIPSGINADSGLISEISINAFKTVTFCTYKPFCFLYPAKKSCGEILLYDVDMPKRAIDSTNPHIFSLDDEIFNLIKEPDKNSHKTSIGTAQIICGSKYMTGAAILCTQAALKSGAGLVYMTTKKCTRNIFQTVLKEPVFIQYKKRTRANAQVIGCGSNKNTKYIKYYLKNKISTVIDADAISYISKHRKLMKYLSTNCIITPHPYEFSKLIDMSVEQIESNRILLSSQFAKKYKTTVILKGHHTLISTSDGNTYINTTGNCGLAKGGSGDVLSGVLCGLLAQGYTIKDSAIISVYLHGKAADNLKVKKSRASMLPSELPDEIGKFIK